MSENNKSVIQGIQPEKEASGWLHQRRDHPHIDRDNPSIDPASLILDCYWHA